MGSSDDDGSDDDGSGGGSTGTGPDQETVALCERWFEAGCTALARCSGQAATFEECMENSRHCAEATDADPDQVDRCAEQLPEAECDAFGDAYAGFCEGAVELTYGAGDPDAAPADTCVEWCAEVDALPDDCNCSIEIEDCIESCRNNACYDPSRLPDTYDKECEASRIAVTCGMEYLAGEPEISCLSEESGACKFLTDMPDECVLFLSY